MSVDADVNVTLWPARTNKNVKRVKTNSPNGIGDEAPLVYDTKTQTVSVPITNSAYDRTVRLNAALRALYTKTNASSYLELALEEARLHMILAKTEGSPRRDELTTALKDLRNTERVKLEESRDMAMLTTVRSLAILQGGPDKPKGTRKLISKKVKKHLPKRAISAIHEALNVLEKDPAKAKRILKSYFKEIKKPTSCQFPLAGQCSGDGGLFMPQGGIKGVQAVRDGIISTESADMLSPETIQGLLDENWLPKMDIVKLTATNAIRTYFGMGEKSATSGIKIKAKKLALTVGPNQPRIFTKPIERETGGTVLIDASGSMQFSDEQLQQICNMLPMATIAYYDSASDSNQASGPDILHVYSEKGLRTTMIDLPRRGGGNMIDFPAIQWVLKQSGPRWFLTDERFTGPAGAITAAQELIANAKARKLIKVVRYIETIINEIERKQRK